MKKFILLTLMLITASQSVEAMQQQNLSKQQFYNLYAMLNKPSLQAFKDYLKGNNIDVNVDIAEYGNLLLFVMNTLSRSKSGNLIDMEKMSRGKSGDLVDITLTQTETDRQALLDIIRFLIDNVTDINKSVKIFTGKHTPLTAAADMGLAEVIKMLLKRKDIEINKRNGQGDTALHLAIMPPSAEIVTLLLQAGADQSIEGQLRRNALMHAKKVLELYNKNWFSFAYRPNAKEDLEKIIELLEKADATEKS